MADEIRKVIDIHIGTEVKDPKLGIEANIIANAHSSKAHLQAISSFSEDGAYFFIGIKSHQPSELKAAFEEFLNTSISVAKEMSPDVDQMVGDSAFEVAIHEDLVIAAVNLKTNPIAKNYADLVETLTSSTIKGEARVKAGLLTDTTFHDLLAKSDEELEKVRADFFLTAQSKKSDKYAIKQKLLEMSPAMRGNGAEQKYITLLTLMFNSAHFTLSSKDAVRFVGGQGDQIAKGRATINGFIGMGKEMYQGNKEMVDSFPFIQAFFDAVEQYGSGFVRLGIYNKLVSAEVDLYGNELGQIYRQIVG